MQVKLDAVVLPKFGVNSVVPVTFTINTVPKRSPEMVVTVSPMSPHKLAVMAGIFG
jgi:hypothetical protein